MPLKQPVGNNRNLSNLLKNRHVVRIPGLAKAHVKSLEECLAACGRPSSA